MTILRIGQAVLFSEVLSQYRYDFAFDGESELLSQFDAANGNDALQLGILGKLRKPKPPIDLAWRYEQLTKDIVSTASLPWKGSPTVPELVARLKNEPPEEIANALGISSGSIVKIQKLAMEPDCGVSDGYQHTILVRDKATECAFKIYEGSHRLCALWLRFAGSWNDGLGAYVGSTT